MTLLRIALGAPPPELWPNARVDWRGTVRPKKAFRGEAKIAALEALRGRPRPRWTEAKVEVFYWIPSGRYRRDRDNVIAALKAAFDGLQDAGVIVNDRGLIVGEVHQPIDPRRRTPHVEIVVSERPSLERK